MVEMAPLAMAPPAMAPPETIVVHPAAGRNRAQLPLLPLPPRLPPPPHRPPLGLPPPPRRPPLGLPLAPRVPPRVGGPEVDRRHRWTYIPAALPTSDIAVSVPATKSFELALR